MARIVELLVGAAALTTIATFIIGHAAWKRVKRLGRTPEPNERRTDDDRNDPELGS